VSIPFTFGFLVCRITRSTRAYTRAHRFASPRVRPPHLLRLALPTRIAGCLHLYAYRSCLPDLYLLDHAFISFSASLRAMRRTRFRTLRTRCITYARGSVLPRCVCLLQWFYPGLPDYGFCLHYTLNDITYIPLDNRSYQHNAADVNTPHHNTLPLPHHYLFARSLRCLPCTWTALVCAYASVQLRDSALDHMIASILYLFTKQRLMLGSRAGTRLTTLPDTLLQNHLPHTPEPFCAPQHLTHPIRAHRGRHSHHIHTGRCRAAAATSALSPPCYAPPPRRCAALFAHRATTAPAAPRAACHLLPAAPACRAAVTRATACRTAAPRCHTAAG